MNSLNPYNFTTRSKMKQVTITAGHGGKDSGAVNGQITESFIATDFRNMVKFYLEKSGITVLSDGNSSENKPLTEAISLAKKSKLAIEFHCNASSNPSAKGVEALANSKDKQLCKDLCLAVAKELSTTTRGADGGWKAEDSGQHHRLGFVQAGGIIMELFFISNPKELEIYLAKKWVIAKAVAVVILGYMNHTA